MGLGIEGFAVGRRRMVFYDLRKLFFLSALAGHNEEVCTGPVESFVTLQLQLEAEVGTHLRPLGFDHLQGLQESHVPVLDEVSND